MKSTSPIQKDLLQSSTSLNTEEVSSSSISQSIEDTISINLINKLKLLLYIEDDLDFNLAAPTLEALLESSGIHYRRAIIKLEKGKAQPPIVFLNSEGDPDILYFLSGNIYVYSPLDDKKVRVSQDYEPAKEGYELFAPLPNDMSSKKALISFLLPVVKNDAIAAIVLSILLTLLSLAVPMADI